MPKVVVLNLFGHDFNFLHGNFIPRTVTWPCFLTAVSLVLFIFFWLLKSYFKVYKIQGIVKLIFYGYSLTGPETTEIERWRLSKNTVGEMVELRDDCEFKGP